MRFGFSIYIEFPGKRRFSKNYVNRYRILWRKLRKGLCRKENVKIEGVYIALHAYR